MTIPAWPSGLPALIGLAGSLGTPQLYEPPQETRMDDGPGRTRRRSMTAETDRSIVLILTRAEFVVFDQFVRVDLNNGTRRFTAPVRLKSGLLGTRTVKIRGAVSETDLGPNSRVAFPLAIRDW